MEMRLAKLARGLLPALPVALRRMKRQSLSRPSALLECLMANYAWVNWLEGCSNSSSGHKTRKARKVRQSVFPKAVRMLSAELTACYPPVSPFRDGVITDLLFLWALFTCKSLFFHSFFIFCQKRWVYRMRMTMMTMMIERPSE